MHWLLFIAYFLCFLAFFTFMWWAIGKGLDRMDERHARHFEEKVDRYRRGHR